MDDAPQVRQELRFLLQLAGELDVVGEAGDGVQAIAQAEALRPHVIELQGSILDINPDYTYPKFRVRGPAPRQSG